MWICQKCNTQNTAKFCGKCGAMANAQSAPNFPPTGFGATPPNVQPPQSNFQPSSNKLEFTKKPLFIGCFFVGVLMFIGIIFAFIYSGHKSMEESISKGNEQSEQYRKKRTAETIGKITDHSTGDRRRADRIIYEFVVDGKTYSNHSLIKNGSVLQFPKGKEGSVCYDPADPTNNTISFQGESRYCGY